MFPSPARRFFQVIFAHDVVAVKDASCLVSRYRHCYPFMDASANHVPNRCAPEVMQYLTGESGFLPPFVPRLPGGRAGTGVGAGEGKEGEAGGGAWNFRYLAP